MNGHVSTTFGLTLALFISIFGQAEDISIDRTCASCPRRDKDSTHVFHRRPIRVNQAGYLPGEKKKTAFVVASVRGEFKIIDPAGQSVFADTLQPLGDSSSEAIVAKGYRDAITLDYTLQSPPQNPALLFLADFGKVQAQGQYRVVFGMDTSATFWIHPRIYDKVLETILFYFGAQRCGNTHSWLHQACHLKDGSALGVNRSGRLAGGWHDCGDHGKYAETTAYTTLILSLAYSVWPQKASDLYGASHTQKQPDGIPDLLAEAKIGADFIYNLYAVSKEEGWLDSGDMAHSVGIGPGSDHQYWGLPEKQDSLASNLGGADRPVSRGIGSNVAGAYAAGLALFAKAWKAQDSVYAGQVLSAAIDIYDRVVMKKRGAATKMPCCYTGGGPTLDDEAMAATALWFATQDNRFGFDLLENAALGQNSLARFNQGAFPAGLLGSRSTFSKGGWPTDYQDLHSLVLYGLAKLILPDAATASNFGISGATRDSLLNDIQVALRQGISDGSNGSNSTAYPGMNVDMPYHDLFTSIEWGYNRYNLGLVTEVFLYHDLTRENAYREVGVDNFNYLLGANPYDISFINGCGDRNMQHPHHRASNPDGLNQAGQSYAYRPLTGAVMGGVKPGKDLKDEWGDYVNSETCIDFAAQAILPLMFLSEGKEFGVNAKAKPYPGRHRPMTRKIPKDIGLTGRKTTIRTR